MTPDEALKAYLPMSETMYLILLSVEEPRHGYGILLHIRNITGGRRELGTGTIYNSLSRLRADGLIADAGGDERRRIYHITETGRAVLSSEIERLGELYCYGKA